MGRAKQLNTESMEMSFLGMPFINDIEDEGTLLNPQIGLSDIG